MLNGQPNLVRPAVAGRLNNLRTDVRLNCWQESLPLSCFSFSKSAVAYVRFLSLGSLMRNLQECEIGAAIDRREVSLEECRIFTELVDFVLLNKNVIDVVLPQQIHRLL